MKQPELPYGLRVTECKYMYVPRVLYSVSVGKVPYGVPESTSTELPTRNLRYMPGTRPYGSPPMPKKT